MFTGIIEALGQIKEIVKSEENIIFSVTSPISAQLRIDQSVSHNGVCLTVTECNSEWHKFTAVKETLSRSNLQTLKLGDVLNLERCLSLNSRLDGHMVQGHVDCNAACLSKKTSNGSWVFRFEYPPSYASLLVAKGSVTVNGVSLTIAELTDTDFSVAIIPYTYEHTNFKVLEEGMKVNIEFDILGKYVQRHLELLNKREI